MEDRPSLGFWAYGLNTDERACERKHGGDVYVDVVLMSLTEGGLYCFLQDADGALSGTEAVQERPGAQSVTAPWF